MHLTTVKENPLKRELYYLQANDKIEYIDFLEKFVNSLRESSIPFSIIGRLNYSPVCWEKGITTKYIPQMNNQFLTGLEKGFNSYPRAEIEILKENEKQLLTLLKRKHLTQILEQEDSMFTIAVNGGKDSAVFHLIDGETTPRLPQESAFSFLPEKLQSLKNEFLAGSLDSFLYREQFLLVLEQLFGVDDVAKFSSGLCILKPASLEWFERRLHEVVKDDEVQKQIVTVVKAKAPRLEKCCNLSTLG